MKAGRNSKPTMRTQPKTARDGPTVIREQKAVDDIVNQNSKQNNQRSPKHTTSSIDASRLSKVEDLSMLDVFLHETNGPISGYLAFSKPENSGDQAKKWPQVVSIRRIAGARAPWWTRV